MTESKVFDFGQLVLSMEKLGWKVGLSRYIAMNSRYTFVATSNDNKYFLMLTCEQEVMRLRIINATSRGVIMHMEEDDPDLLIDSRMMVRGGNLIKPSAKQLASFILPAISYLRIAELEREIKDVFPVEVLDDNF